MRPREAKDAFDKLVSVLDRYKDQHPFVIDHERRRIKIDQGIVKKYFDFWGILNDLMREEVPPDFCVNTDDRDNEPLLELMLRSKKDDPSNIKHHIEQKHIANWIQQLDKAKRQDAILLFPRLFFLLSDPSSQEKLLAQLIEAGADPFIYDKDGYRPEGYMFVINQVFTQKKSSEENQNENIQKLLALHRRLNKYIERVKKEVGGIWGPYFIQLFGFTFFRKPNQQLNQRVAQSLSQDLQIIIATQQFNKLQDPNFVSKAYIDKLRVRAKKRSGFSSMHNKTEKEISSGTIRSSELNKILDDFYKLRPAQDHKPKRRFR